jgi:hypothetical protein
VEERRVVAGAVRPLLRLVLDLEPLRDSPPVALVHALARRGLEREMFVSGRCPHCQKAVTELLTPAPRAGLQQSEYLALLGALGLLTGLALASAGEGRD